MKLNEGCMKLYNFTETFGKNMYSYFRSKNSTTLSYKQKRIIFLAHMDIIFLPQKLYLNIISKSLWALFKTESSIFKYYLSYNETNTFTNVFYYFRSISVYFFLVNFLIKIIHSQGPLLYKCHLSLVCWDQNTSGHTFL